MSTEQFSLKEAILVVKKKSDPNGLYVVDIITTFGARSHAFLVLFFCLPFIQPLPMMGLSTVFGGIIILLSTFMALEKSPWLPKKFMSKHIKHNLVVSSCDALIKLLSKTEKLIKPRFNFWLKLPPVRIFNAFSIAFFAFLLALPLPIPFSNSVPAYFMVLNAIGLLEDDGVLILVSYVIAIAGLLFFASLGMGATEFIDWFRLKIGI
ncbi:MAG: exopolysaccharide biosynthesis protein [Bdellovibrionales bacterium]|nr:exopolysaccharide biosynthesis protein [Bdellovibrionales bacterium]